jgi:hypothetical protein
VAPNGANNQDQGPAEMIGDLWQLIRDYAKQETIDPLKAIGNFLKWGLPGAVLLSLGLLFGSLAILRGLQSETGDHLTGSYTWVPYGAALVFALLAAALAVVAIRKPASTS